MADQKAGPMGVEELDELERLHLDATPEPWEAYVNERDRNWYVSRIPGDVTGKKFFIFRMEEGDDEPDAALIATMRNALPRLLALARSALTAYAAGREKGLEEAARWHEERAARVERESPDLSVFLSDADLEYIAKREAADREDAAALRALAAQPPPALAQPSATRKEE